MLIEEALIFQHLSCYLQIIFMRNFQRCSVFSLYSEWHRVVTNQSVNKKLRNLAASCVETDCSLIFVSKMKFSVLDPDFIFCDNSAPCKIHPTA